MNHLARNIREMIDTLGEYRELLESYLDDPTIRDDIKDDCYQKKLRVEQILSCLVLQAFFVNDNKKT